MVRTTLRTASETQASIRAAATIGKEGIMIAQEIQRLPALTNALAAPVMLLPPLPNLGHSIKASGGTNPCAGLTNTALQELIDTLTQSLASAEADVIASSKGAYAIAAVYNRDYLSQALQSLLYLQSWLKSLGLDIPFVSNASAAYNIHGYVRENVYLLHHARHWASISIVYHKSPDAFDSFDLTSTTIDLAEALGARAGRCYVSSYYP